MRRCEECKGPGPCLWADSGPYGGKYCCVKCHPMPHDEFFRRGACSDCPEPAVARYWQSGGALGQRAERDAERKGYVMRLCERHNTGVSSAVWTLSGHQPEPARSAVYTIPVCSYCGQPAGSVACQRQHP